MNPAEYLRNLVAKFPSEHGNWGGKIYIQLKMLPCVDE
jgi:hypothetical protein